MGICPMLSKCAEKVNIEKYNKVCVNLAEDAFKNCDAYKKAMAETKTPLEWGKLLSAV